MRVAARSHSGGGCCFEKFRSRGAATHRGRMITPEFVREKHGEFILVANHNLETEENVARSIDYNLARIINVRRHLSTALSRCRLIYDIRGHAPWSGALERIEITLADICTIEVKR